MLRMRRRLYLHLLMRMRMQLRLRMHWLCWVLLCRRRFYCDSSSSTSLSDFVHSAPSSFGVCNSEVLLSVDEIPHNLFTCRLLDVTHKKKKTLTIELNTI